MDSIFNKLAPIGWAIINCLVWGSVLTFFVWAVGALYFLLYLPSWLRVVLAIAYAIAIPISIWRSSSQSLTRSWIAGSILSLIHI